MEANELRIGNFVMPDGNHFEKFQIEPHHFSHEDLIDLIIPIPLTEEWLLKFGVKRTTGYNEKGLEMLYIETAFFKVECSYVFLEYVHQLQNLYFALTGSELIIKEQ